MFKNKSKKLIFRILLLMLVDAMIITLAGPVANLYSLQSVV